MRPVRLTLAAGAATSANSVCLSQTPGAAGPLTLNGAAVSGGVATFSPAVQASIASTGNDSGTNFTFNGVNASGQTVSETIAGPNNNTVNTKNFWLSITSVVASASVGTALTVGNLSVSVTQWIPLDRQQAPFSVGIGVALLTGNPNYTVEHTFDDVFDPTVLPVAWPNFSLVNVTGQLDGNYNAPVVASRLKINSGSGSLKIMWVQGMQP